MSRQRRYLYNELRRRNQFPKYQWKYFFYNILRKNIYTPVIVRYKISIFLNKYLFYYAQTTQRNRCRITARAHSVVTTAGLARIPFRFLAGCGLISGISICGK